MSNIEQSFGRSYYGRRVLVTGHTGFKGAWLCEWLLALGAEVTGFALPPPTSPSLFDQLGLATRMEHIIGDVRDLAAVNRTVAGVSADFVFHLAAQPLVRASYAEPVPTYATNVMGTIHVLEALRLRNRPCVAVMITTDKCYENQEWVHSYRENDPVGGHDPYSSSKGAAELAIAAYRRSFFSVSGSHVRVASARAGNVIGGGDWASDRIVPDCIRSLRQNAPILVRNPTAKRPWQHVLEPLSGYLQLGASLSRSENPAAMQLLLGAFNFGPPTSSNRTVADLVERVLKSWPGQWQDASDEKAVHEAKLLNLATDKAHHYLKWYPVWDFAETVARTITWYRQCGTQNTRVLTQSQIEAYVAAAAALNFAWSQ